MTRSYKEEMTRVVATDMYLRHLCSTAAVNTFNTIPLVGQQCVSDIAGTFIRAICVDTDMMTDAFNV